MLAGDHATARDGMAVGALVPLADHGGWDIVWTVRKYADETAFTAGGPYEISEVPGNLVTTAGWTRIVSLMNGAGGTAVTTTTARVGVGNGAGTAAAGDTDLSAAAGSTNRWFQTCTVSIATNVITLAATFASADGNFAWNEFGIDVATATVTSGNTVGTLLLNHKTSIAQGTKASGQVWTATATITFT
jgi:hypothetical protein